MLYEMKLKDGRAERTRRSKDTIVEALLSLYKDGNFVPTAQEVADRSGMGIRTVFRHFNEMESLFIAGDTLLHKLYDDKTAPILDGSLEQRCQQLVDLRAKNCARICPYIMAAQAQAWKYKILKSNYRKLCAVFKKRMLIFIPELNNQPQAVIDSVELILSFESWQRLRHIQKLSQKESKAIMLRTLRAVMNTPAS